VTNSTNDGLTLHMVRKQLTDLGVTIRWDRDLGEYRVNFCRGREGTAYYTGSLMDALATGKVMAAWEAQAPSQPVISGQG